MSCGSNQKKRVFKGVADVVQHIRVYDELRTAAVSLGWKDVHGYSSLSSAAESDVRGTLLAAGNTLLKVTPLPENPHPMTD